MRRAPNRLFKRPGKQVPLQLIGPDPMRQRFACQLAGYIMRRPELDPFGPDQGIRQLGNGRHGFLDTAFYRGPVFGGAKMFAITKLYLRQ